MFICYNLKAVFDAIRQNKLVRLFNRAVAFSLLVGLGSSVLAHATIVFGTLESVPSTLQAGEPFSLVMALNDPTGVPVEDAWVLAEFRPEGASEGSEPVSVRFEETEPGTYEAGSDLA